jgi:hypothetical protein
VTFNQRISFLCEPNKKSIFTLLSLPHAPQLNAEVRLSLLLLLQWKCNSTRGSSEHVLRLFQIYSIMWKALPMIHSAFIYLLLAAVVWHFLEPFATTFRNRSIILLEACECVQTRSDVITQIFTRKCFRPGNFLKCQ